MRVLVVGAGIIGSIYGWVLAEGGHQVILHDLSGINHLLPKVTQQIVAGEPVAMFALEAERDRRQPEAGERMLLNPETSEPMTRPRLYHRMMTLGKRAGVPGASA